MAGGCYDYLVNAVRRCMNLTDARHVHDQIVSRCLHTTTYLGNLLVEMYGKHGSLDEASRVFQHITLPNVYSWNILLTAFARNGDVHRAVAHFWRMQLEGERPDRVTWLVLLDMCAHATLLRLGSHFHLCIRQQQHALVSSCRVAVNNAVLHMYSKCGCLPLAEDMFATMPERDVVTWSSMLAAYVDNTHHTQALKLVEKMDLEGEKPSFITYISILEACVGAQDYKRGVSMHERITEAGLLDVEVNLGNALLSMYSKFGRVDEAREVFDRMGSTRNTVTWNAMMSAYAHHGGGASQALYLLRRMDMEGHKPSKVTFLSMLDSCPTTTYANFLHRRVAAAGYGSDSVVTNALINMYGKSGELKVARELFDGMSEPNVCSWSTMIDAYAQRGHHEKALEMFTQMLLHGFTPTHITFISVLCACSHGGLAHKGWMYFASMLEDFGISPVQEHFGCLVDMFGRLGWLHAAGACASNSTFYDNPVAWIILLAACKTHGHVSMAEQAANLAMQLDPHTQTSYILLSNMYTEESAELLE